MNKKLWYEAFSRKDMPSFPCPHCRQTTLELEKDTLQVKEPIYSEKSHAHSEWEPEYTVERFVVLLRCTRSGLS